MRIILSVVVMLLSGLAFSCLGDNDVNLSTPEKTIRSYYEGFKRSDFEYQKKTLLDPAEPSAKSGFDAVIQVLQGYEIVKIREAKDRKDDTIQLPEDDVQVIVKEIYKNGKESINSIILRKRGGKWLIEGFDTVQDPPGMKVTEENARVKKQRETTGSGNNGVRSQHLTEFT
jgi:hypothetical protein